MFAYLAKLKIVHTITLLSIIPSIAALVFLYQLIKVDTEDEQKLAALSQLTRLSVKIGSLVHEQQKERGATALFLASKGQQFEADLKSQRKATDTARIDYLQFLEALTCPSISQHLPLIWKASMPSCKRRPGCAPM